MRKVGGRANALLILAALILTGLALWVARLIAKGPDWVSFAPNKTVYSDGVLALGTVTDRDGLVLSGASGGQRYYADDAAVRASTLHAVGDIGGNIGTGALKAFASRLIGYDFFSGAYSRAGAGKTVALSIDADLNVAAYEALGGRKGTVAVVNYETGELVCMVSSPSFDPQNPPDLEDSRYEGVYLNRFLSSAYTPGSTFKLVTLAAAIENIDGLYDRVFACDGGLNVGGETVTCSGVHGELKIEDALAVSCNSAFGELALELGGDTLARYAEKLGLTESLEIDGIQTAAGNFTAAPDETSYLAWSGIGQYEDTVCPAAMLRLVSAIANGGRAVDLTLLKPSGLGSVLPAGSERLMSADTADKIATMMNYNVYKTYGQENFPGLELYAKSGTAEVGGGAAPHAWFVGFITNQDYPLAFVAVVENGGGGSHSAGPVVNAVLQAAVFGR